MQTHVSPEIETLGFLLGESSLSEAGARARACFYYYYYYYYY